MQLHNIRTGIALVLICGSIAAACSAPVPALAAHTTITLPKITSHLQKTEESRKNKNNSNEKETNQKSTAGTSTSTIATPLVAAPVVVTHTSSLSVSSAPVATSTQSHASSTSSVAAGSSGTSGTAVGGVAAASGASSLGQPLHDSEGINVYAGSRSLTPLQTVQLLLLALMLGALGLL